MCHSLLLCAALLCVHVVEALQGERLSVEDRTKLKQVMGEWLMLSAEEKLAVIREQQREYSHQVRMEERRRMREAMRRTAHMDRDSRRTHTHSSHAPHSSSCPHLAADIFLLLCCLCAVDADDDSLTAPVPVRRLRLVRLNLGDSTLA